MMTDEIEARLIAIIERERAAGCTMADSNLIQPAIRRWRSYERRHRKHKNKTHDHRVHDLTKGLLALFPDHNYDEQCIRHLAQSFAFVLDPDAPDEETAVVHSPSSSGREIHLRDVTEDDLSVFFDHQRDPVANEAAAFPARNHDDFMAHWSKIMADETVVAKAIILDGCVAGNVLSWSQDGCRLVGYWVGRDYWGQGVATRALFEFLQLATDRPLHAHVAKHNIASIRVLEKCGFAMCMEETRGDTPADGVEEVVYVYDS